MELTHETIRDLKLSLHRQASDNYNQYLYKQEQVNEKLKSANKRPIEPVSYEDWCAKSQQTFHVTSAHMMHILNCADAGLDVDHKTEAPLTAEQKNDYYKRYFSESQGDVADRKGLFCEFRRYSDGVDMEPNSKNPANLTVSKLDNGNHMPAFDIDMPCRLVPSKSPGHYHMMIDKEMSWENYQLFLNVLSIVGIVERGYVDASVKKGYTGIRVGPEELVANEIMRDVKYDSLADVFTENDPDSVVQSDAIRLDDGGDPCYELLPS